MALFGGIRDISLFRHLNRELLGDIITQQCIYYKFKLGETKVNMYGEASGAKFYNEPVILNALISRDDQTHPTDEFGVDFAWNIEFRFFRDEMSIDEIIEESKLPFELAQDTSKQIETHRQMAMWDNYLDSNNGCSESCEAF